MNNSNNTIHKGGLLRANANGLYDIYGNVAEITRDSYPTAIIPTYKSNDPEINPLENNGEYHILRGGSYEPPFPNSYQRSAIRKDSYNPTTGFRVVFEK